MNGLNNNIVNNNVNNLDNAFEIVDINALNREMAAANAQGRDNVPPPENADRRNVLENAHVGELDAPQDLTAQLRDRVENRHSFSSRFTGIRNALGRGLLSFCQVFKRLLCPAYRRQNVAGFNRIPGDGRPVPAPREDWKVMLDENDTITYGNDELAAGFGLRGRARIRPFREREIDDIRNGDFRLEHIRQDPGFQDCWFLSSISSLLRTKGTQAIRDIIHVPEGEDVRHAFVKLGDNVYRVPLGEVTCGGHRSVSRSAAWVRLLETAMQMHLIRTQPNNPRMAFRDTAIGLAALTGVGFNDIHRRGADVTIAHLRRGLELGIPMVMGIDGPSSTKNLDVGIASRHAVTVVDVTDDNHAVVMDPYGHTTVVHARDLHLFTLFSTESVELDEEAGANNQQVQPQAVGQVQAQYVDNDGNDF